jgi:gamma-glutamyltranspeptidase/glutathione hydrolase
MKRRGGLLAARDLAEPSSEWVDPIATTYRGHQVLELPPNTQGIVALEMLNILEGLDLKTLGHNSAAYLHLLVEAKRIAFADRDAHVADPASVPAPLLKTLLSKEYASLRRKGIDLSRAAPSYAPGVVQADEPQASSPKPQALGDTVYLTAADGRGHVISLIQSIYENFGAGIVAGDTGIVLHNRGSLFTLAPGTPGIRSPRTSASCTLVPAMVLIGQAVLRSA